MKKLLSSLIIAALVVAGLLYFFGPSYWVERALRDEFKDYQVEEQQKSALRSAAESLSRIEPTAYARLSSETVQMLILHELKKIKELSNVKVYLKEQTVNVTSDFELRGDPKDDQAAKFRVGGNLVAQLYPVYLSAQRQLSYFPSFQSINITDLDYEPGIAKEIVKETIDKLTSSLLDRINAYLNQECSTKERDDPLRIPQCFLIVPEVAKIKVDFKEELEKGGDLSNVTGRVVTMDLDLPEAAILVSDNGIEILLAANTEANDSKKKETALDEASMSYEEYSERFRKKTKASFGDLDLSNGVQFVLRSSLTTSVLNRLLDDAGISFEAAIDDKPKDIPRSEVRLAKRPTFECAPDMSCDTKSCREVRCDSQKLGCIKDRGEIGKLLNKGCKTVFKVICEGGKAAGSLICETVSSLSKGSCEAVKTLKKFGCEGNKVFVDKVFGRVGYVNGDYRIYGRYDIRIDKAAIGEGLSSISLGALASASARTKGHLRFVPVDHGHALVCVATWKEDFDVDVVVPYQKLTLNAQRESVETKPDGTLRLNFLVSPFSVKGTVSPPLFSAVFDKHPHLRLNCGLPSGIGDLARLVRVIDGDSDIIPDELNQIVSGKIEQEVKKVRFAIELPGDKIKIKNKPYSVDYKPFLSENVLGFSGKVSIDDSSDKASVDK